jgi:hypothetical protein
MIRYAWRPVRVIAALSTLVAGTIVGAGPASAASAAPAVPGAATGSVTLSATREVSPGTRASAQDVIVCVVSVTNPGNGGSGRVKAAGLAVCTATVDSINLQVGIYRGNVLAASDRLFLFNTYINGFELDTGCLTADYGATAIIDVVFPQGYVPRYGSAMVWSSVNHINCGAPPTPPTPGQPPFGQLEIAENTGDDGNIHLSGWAINPSTTAPVKVTLYYRGAEGYVFAGTIMADVPRPDIVAVYPQFGPNHGFDANANEGEIIILPPEDWPWGYPGEFDICAFAGPTELGCGKVMVNGG